MIAQGLMVLGSVSLGLAIAAVFGAGIAQIGQMLDMDAGTAFLAKAVIVAGGGGLVMVMLSGWLDHLSEMRRRGGRR